MASNNYTSGKLYLIPTTLGDNEPLEVLPISIKKAVENIDYYIVENEKSARRFIKKISPRKSQSKIHIELLNKYTDATTITTFLNPCSSGHDVGVLSEAGCPAIADPGADIVQLAHEKKLQVIPLVGPSSVILALMASGFNGQNFAFNGYLPIEINERKKAIKRLEKRAKEEGQSQIFIETPYRNNKLFQELLKSLELNTQLCIACDLTLASEFILAKNIRDWRSEQLDINKRPAIFILQAPK